MGLLEDTMQFKNVILSPGNWPQLGQQSVNTCGKLRKLHDILYINIT